MTSFFKKLLLVVLILQFRQVLFAQKDTEFWFVAPEITQGLNNYDRPVVFRFSSYAQPAVITISQPANPNFPTQTLSVAANSTVSLEFPPLFDMVENTPADMVLNFGFLIQSTAYVSAYYEVLSQYQTNPEIFSLKGKNALGTSFLVPFQNQLRNSDAYSPLPSAAFDIVASEDNTTVTIAPTRALVGHAANVPFSVTLQRGQTYSAKSAGQLATQHPSGTRVTANRPIAITMKDDLLESGTYFGGYCRDLIGDQLVPVSKLGTQYIIQKGDLNTDEFATVVATADNTAIYLDGSFQGTINAGALKQLTVSQGAHFIETTAPVYVWQITGIGCEVGGEIMPTLGCSGSSSVRFVRSTGNDFYLFLVTQSGNESGFLLNGNANLIPVSGFQTVPGTNGAWVASVVNLSSTTDVLVNQSSLIENTKGLFQMGFLDGSFNTGCRYGFFSDFGNKLHLYESVQFCPGDTIVKHGISIASTGTYFATTTNTQGCDTLFEITAVGLPYVTRADTFSLCPSDTIYINGIAYTQPGVVVDTLPAISGCDTIVTYTIVRGLNPAITQTLSFCPGDSVTINGQVYTQPGATVSYFIPAQVGCDTLVTWHLEWAQQPTITKNIAFCPGDNVVIDGISYNQPDTIQGVIPAATGCDTLATYVLSFAPQPSITKNIAFCLGDSVSIDGIYYAQPGTISGVIPATTGCDTLATYVLSFATQPRITKNIAFCPGDHVVIDGVSYTQPGTVNGVIPAAVGCDTLATYVLSFAPQPSITKNIAFCPGDSVVIDGIHYAQPGTVSGVIPATTGCDTLATYVLSFAPQPSITKNRAFCPGDFVVIDGVSYNQPGTVHGVIPAAIGCDTLATYVLSFAPQPTTTDTLAFCPGDSVSIHGQSYKHPGIVTLTLPATSGCDTIATYLLKYALPNTPTHILINCPLDIYVDTDPGDTVQAVTYLTPTTNTDCPCPGISLQLQQGLPSGSLFHVGETDVCYTAKDSCGNAITCCFKVTVTESAACDIKEIGCVKFELLGITADAQQRKTYRVRVTNKCAQKLSYVAIQVPDGIVADLPLTNTLYAAPSGREYLVRNPNYSPIYSVRFSSQTDSIFGGQSDIFKYTLPPQAAPTFINVKVRLEPQVYYETHLNVFDCVVEYAPNNKTAKANRSEDLSIYPNPTSGLLYADWTHLSWQPILLNIYNSLGQLIESRNVQPDVFIEQILLPEKMTEGLYLLEIQSVTGQKESRKFMYVR